MRRRRAEQHADNRHRSIRVALTRAYNLPERATAEKHTAQPGQRHPEKIPERILMRDRLPVETDMNQPEIHIADQHSSRERHHAQQHGKLPEQKDMAECADETKARPLHDCANRQPRREREPSRRMLGSRAFLAGGEKIASEEKQQQQRERKQGEP